MRFETRAIHEGQMPDPGTGAVCVPVYQTSTFRQDAVGQHLGFEYSRTGNPTRQALEQALASLEGSSHGLAFASGLAATSAVFSLLRPGDHVLAGNDIYGGTYRLLEKVFRPYGLEISYADSSSPDDFEDAIQANTRLIWVETPTNPLLKVSDLRRLAELSRKRGCLLAVDNTFASPFLQRPLEMGAHLVVHSTTKYLGGHSDLVGGAVISADLELHDRLKFYQNAAGIVPGPWDSWLVLRGIKTLAVRMQRHCRSALSLARLLEKHPSVRSVHYPGLPSHPNHELARKQMDGFGGMLSFELEGDQTTVDRFFSRLKIIILAESLGGVDSLISHPARMTHASFPPEERERRGIGDSLVRLSVGLEHIADLKHDLLQALGR